MLNKSELKEFKKQTEKLNELKEEYLKKKAKFAEENSGLLGAIDEQTVSLVGMKENLSIAALDEFKETQNKQLLGGLGIRVGSNLIYEKERALGWAKEHGLCLALDDSAFKKIAKTQDIEFVQKEEKITVTFPKEIKLEGE